MKWQYYLLAGTIGFALCAVVWRVLEFFDHLNCPVL